MSILKSWVDGLCVFVGPALVALFFDAVNTKGIIWILSGLYLIAAILTRFLKAS